MVKLCFFDYKYRSLVLNVKWLQVEYVLKNRVWLFFLSLYLVLAKPPRAVNK